MESTRKTEKCCDIVMKGGITSGVVYPGAVAELAKVFQLKSIGGTSAGAIAAAAAAAAALGKLKSGSDESFEKLAELPKFLSKTNTSGKTNLFTFFQPQKRLVPLFHTLTAGLECKNRAVAVSKILVRAVWHFPAWPSLVLVAGAFLISIETTPWLKVAWFVVAVVISIAVIVWRLVAEFGKRLPGLSGNMYGLCTGMSSESAHDAKVGPSTDRQALTIWLSKYVNELAGLPSDGDPLTFGQLWCPEDAPGSPPSATRIKQPAIRLEMFTTCLSKGRPFRLPFGDEGSVHENRFYFNKSEFERLFPPKVVEWLERHPRSSNIDQKWKDEGFLPMPDPWNLPVVVATRMSLSFPILLSAVPLRDYDDSIKDIRKSSPPEVCWFSDGGISSNFPVHLFDSPIPRWPTFGINLVEKSEESTDASLRMPWMPTSNDKDVHETWTRFEQKGGLASIVGFIWSIIGTMQNWTDNTLSHMPGFRDRIALVGLRPSEGGLNLSMPEDRIKALNDRGVNAAIEFTKRFDDNEPKWDVMNWPNHRWIRFRSMMAAMEEMIASVDRTCDNPENGDVGYQQWVESFPLDAEPSYKWTGDKQREAALQTLAALRDIAASWKGIGVSAADKSPRPRPELRPRPRI